MIVTELVIEYLKSSNQKLYHHKIKLPDLKSTDLSIEIVKKIRNRHSGFFGKGKLDDEQIKKIVERIQSNMSNEENRNLFLKPKVDEIYSKSKTEDNQIFGKKQPGSLGNGNNAIKSQIHQNKIDILEESLENGIDYHNFDLNKLEPEEVQKHKEKMDKKFRKNSLKPGDIGFEFDIRAEFIQNEIHDWDMDSD